MSIRNPMRAALVALLLAVLPAGVSAQSPAPVEVAGADGAAVEIADSSRVVTLGGVITEIAWALGAADQVVGFDASSYYPAEIFAKGAPLPYYRMLAAEPVLALDPTLVVGTADAGPAEVIQQLRDAGVPVLLLPADGSVDTARSRILAVGTALGHDAEAAAIVETLDADLAAAADLVAGAPDDPSVLFLLLPPGAPLLASGTGTEADGMIGLAGAHNALADVPGYVPLTPEVAAAAAPDIILTTASSLQAAGGVEGLLATPGLAETPAGQAGAVVALDDLELLGFGPRTGQAVAELAKALHPELAQ